LVLFLVGIGSFFAPFGLVWSTLIGLAKGDTVCACPGCVDPATVNVDFKGDPRLLERRRSLVVRYCERHAASPPAKVFPHIEARFVAVVMLLLFLLCYCAVSYEAFNEPHDGFGLKAVAITTLASVFVVNGVYYFYWLYLDWWLTH
jgi:hypothetical protein